MQLSLLYDFLPSVALTMTHTVDILYCFYAVLSVYGSGYADTRMSNEYYFKDIYQVDTWRRTDIQWIRGYTDT